MACYQMLQVAAIGSQLLRTLVSRQWVVTFTSDEIEEGLVMFGIIVKVRSKLDWKVILITRSMMD